MSRKLFADRIVLEGLVMAPSCRQCRSAGCADRCTLSARLSGRCSRCVERNNKCSFLVSVADFASLDRQRSKLRLEIRKAKEVQAKALSEQLRNELLLESIDKREKALFDRGLEAVEAVEQQEAEMSDLFGPSVLHDAATVSLDVDWFGLDFPAGTVEALQNNS